MRSVAIALPAYGQYDARVAYALMDLASELRGFDCAFARIAVTQNPDIANVHNGLYERFLASDAERLLVIDSDVVFDVSDARRLLLEEQHDIVGGNYARKGLGRGMASTPRPGGAVLGELVEADVLATGFCSISRRALERIGEGVAPYVDDDMLVRSFVHAGPGLGRWITTDEWLCRRWQSLGEIAWIDTSIRLGHVGAHEFRQEHAQ